MALSYKTIVKAAALTGSAASVYTAPALTSTAINAATVSNPTGGAVTVEIHLVPVAGSATSGNRIASKSIPAGRVLPISEVIGHKLETGMQLFAVGNGLALTVSGSEYIAT